MVRVPTLVGMNGHVKNELVALEYGKPLTIGRSRRCDVSLRRSEIYRKMKPDQRDNDVALKTVSSQHFKITMFNLGSIEIVNMSENGTMVDGKPVNRVIITDVSNKPHEIRFGAKESFRLELREHAKLPEML
ncbi:MAG: FHA domain-containing protein [Planctomycetota bacterium]